MALSNAQSNSSRPQRLRSQALWALLVAAIGLCATVVGLAQYVLKSRSGLVSIRSPVPPHLSRFSLSFLSALSLESSVSSCAGVSSGEEPPNMALVRTRRESAPLLKRCAAARRTTLR